MHRVSDVINICMISTGIHLILFCKRSTIYIEYLIPKPMKKILFSLLFSFASLIVYATTVTNKFDNNLNDSIRSVGSKIVSLSTDYWRKSQEIKHVTRSNSTITGDVNGDRKVNVTDVMMVVSHILGDKDDRFIIANADLNDDQLINVTDVMLIVNVILTSDSQDFLLCPDNHHPHMIDLGLPSGTKWACCNVGAEKPEEYGEYYPFGQTEENNEYEFNSEGYDGEICGSENDVAHVKWESPWLMPNEEQFDELLENCTSEWTTINGVDGRIFKGSNGNAIFLPSAGNRNYSNYYGTGSRGYYWSGSYYSSSFADEDIEYNVTDAVYLGFDSSDSYTSADIVGPSWEVWDESAYSVRPVAPEGSVLPLKLSTNGMFLPIGGESMVDILSGSGNYTMENSHPNRVEVTIEGNSIKVNGIADGSVIIKITDTKTGRIGILYVDVLTVTPASSLCPDSNHPHIIDLGLPSGIKWSCCNLDTKHSENQSPTNYGGYYAWGELAEKSDYSWATYTHCDGYWSSCHDIGTSISGTEHDVAHKEWGDNWQMPSYDNAKELFSNTESTATFVDGVLGWIFTGSNNSRLFIPMGGFREGTTTNYQEPSPSYNYSHSRTGYFWLGDKMNSYQANDVVVTIEGGEKGCMVGFSYFKGASRYLGFNVRPVTEIAVTHLQLSDDYVDVAWGDIYSVYILSGSGSYTVESSDEEVASAYLVDDNTIEIYGAMLGGEATITVTDTKTGETATIEVWVMGPIPFSLSEESLSLEVGETAIVYPYDGNDSYTIECSDEDVVTVEYVSGYETDEGEVILTDPYFLITAVGTGNATITVTDDWSGEMATIEVTVTDVSFSLRLNNNHSHMIDLDFTSGTRWDCCNVDTMPKNLKLILH